MSDNLKSLLSKQAVVAQLEAKAEQLTKEVRYATNRRDRAVEALEAAKAELEALAAAIEG